MKDMLTDDGKFQVKEKWYLYREELMANLLSYIEVKYEAKPLPDFKKSVFCLVRTLVKDIASRADAVECFFVKVLMIADDPIPLPKSKAKAAPKTKAAAAKGKAKAKANS